MNLEIVAYQPHYKAAFAALNRQWLEAYFHVEPEDERVLSDPEGAIIHKGGHIMLALLEGQPVGTCALMGYHDGSVELAKLAVHPDYRGRGIGKKLVDRAILWAREMGARRITLTTNDALQTAIEIYKRAGFRMIEPSGTRKYSRTNTYMERLVE